MLIFIKLGGSLITDKRQERAFRADEMTRLAQEVATARNNNPDLNLLIGHGSGSFGHVAASKHGTMQGVSTTEQWRGFAEVALTAADLNFRVATALFEAGVPVLGVQPSASARCEDGGLLIMNIYSIKAALTHGLVPLIYGDVAFDDDRGGTIISTETVMSYVAEDVPVNQILLLGEVEGVLDTDGTLIPEITPQNIRTYADALGGSAGTDVTGGMYTKVQDMLKLVMSLSGLTIRIFDGREPGLLQATLNGEAQPGTLIHYPQY